MFPYNYAKNEAPFELSLVGKSSLRAHYEVKFPSACQADYVEGNTVFADYFVPQNTEAPLMIILHGYGDTSLAPCLTLARLLVRNGVATFVVYLPFHSRRLPPGRQGSMLTGDARMWFEINRRAIIEIRQVVDWACTRGEIIKHKIGITGISLGGMISSIAMAVDKRINIGVFITIGGNLKELGWGNKSVANQVGHNCTREECWAVYEQYPEYLLKVKNEGLEGIKPAKECFLIDPLTFAEYLQGRQVLMINGKDDEVVSSRSTQILWEACGKPPLRWISGTHSEAYSQSTLINEQIIQFLNK